MADRSSPRIVAAVAALPLTPDMRVLEIGCGPGVAARLVSRQLTTGTILAIDRSDKAIEAARAGSHQELATGRLAFRCVAVEDLIFLPGVVRFDLAFAMRVGVLDGRHPQLQHQAMRRLKAALHPDGVLIIDNGAPLLARDLPAFLDSGARFP